MNFRFQSCNNFHSVHYTIELQANPKKFQKNPQKLFLAYVGETKLSYGIFLNSQFRSFKVIDQKTFKVEFWDLDLIFFYDNSELMTCNLRIV